MMSSLVASGRLFLLLSWIALVLPIFWISSRLRPTTTLPILAGFWRVFCRLIGIEVVVRGDICVDAPVLYVANHNSYLDIPILGAVVPGFFVAKSEVSSWPGIGFLARVAHTVFVERRAQRTAEQRDELQRRLDKGESLILFPEGTSSDGNRVLPFKSALFSVAERNGGNLPVQPVSVAYTHLDGMPMGRLIRPFYAWYGDMILAPHAWAVLGLGRMRVELEFHPPLTLVGCGSRKHLSARAHRFVARGVGRALTGRQPSPPASDFEGPEIVPVR